MEHLKGAAALPSPPRPSARRPSLTTFSRTAPASPCTVSAVGVIKPDVDVIRLLSK